MYLGNVAEVAQADDLYQRPKHPYTQALISAVPIPDPVIEAQRKRVILQGDIPSPLNPPTGCPFHTRCPVAIDRCKREKPPLVEVAPQHQVACFLAEG
jgi:oligopeptide/dipeptide ABC transporter ATP-binding protein